MNKTAFLILITIITAVLFTACAGQAAPETPKTSETNLFEPETDENIPSAMYVGDDSEYEGPIGGTTLYKDEPTRVMKLKKCLSVTIIPLSLTLNLQGPMMVRR